jgi:hypothetical protein
MKTMTINEKLFNLQQEIGTISKDAKNPFYKSKYFDINSLINQLQPLLKKNRLLLLQPIEEDMVVSKLICIDGTGAVISGLRLPEINDPQKLGSAITYYRRYTLASLLGLQAVDDDANIASGATTMASSNEELPWLNEDSPQYKAVKTALTKGTATIADVRKKFKVSKKVESLLK